MQLIIVQLYDLNMFIVKAFKFKNMNKLKRIT